MERLGVVGRATTFGLALALTCAALLLSSAVHVAQEPRVAPAPSVRARVSPQSTLSLDDDSAVASPNDDGPDRDAVVSETAVPSATSRTHPADPASPPVAARGSIPPDAVAMLAGIELDAPHVYGCYVDVLGWRDAAGGVVCLRVLDAEPAGFIDATGEARPEADAYAGAANAPDYSSRLESLAILASAPTSPPKPGLRLHVRVVLFPNGPDATFLIDDSGD